MCASLMSVLGSRIRQLCSVFGLMDIPDERKHHSQPTPLIGGLALLLIILPISLVAMLEFGQPLMHVSTILYCLAVAAMAGIGIADDRDNLTANTRLVMSLSLFMILSLIDPLFMVRVLHFGTPNLTFGLLNNAVAAIFTTLCCVGLVNAVNMADGKNGLVIGLLIGWLAVLMRFAPPSLFPLLIIFEAGLAILYIMNMLGHVFLGDGGSYGFASALGLLSIAIYNKGMATQQPHPLTADIIVVLFIVPVFDSFRLTFARMSKGRSPMAADRDHLHHHLLDRFGWPGGLLVYYLVAFAPVSIWLLVFYR